MSIPSGLVAVVIATHQPCPELHACIAGHLALLEDPTDLVFVDNGSGGSLSRWMGEQFPAATVITQPENGFFCGGYNAGLAHALNAGYEYILIVNADTTVINERYIAQLLAASTRHPKAGFLGPKVYIGEVGIVQNTVLTYPWFGRYLLSWFTSRLAGHNRSANLQDDTEAEFLNGVCVLCRASALSEIGLMDEVMGGYVEDTDWSWRARQLGWKSIFVPVPSIVHHQVPAEYASYSFKSFMLRRNHVYWHKKNGRNLQALCFALCSLILCYARAVLAAVVKTDTKAHWYYVRRFQQVIVGILCNRRMGAWFGPPVGGF